MSPNGRWVASSVYGSAVLWDLMHNNPSVHTFRLPPIFPVSPGKILHIIFSPDSERLLVVSDGGAAHVWDVKRRRRLGTITCDPIVGAWSPCCIVLITGTGTIFTFNSSTYQPIRVHTLEDGLQWGYGGTNIYTTGNYPRPQTSLLFSPDYRWVAVSFPSKWPWHTWTLWAVGEDGSLTRHRVLSDTAKILRASTGNPYFYGKRVAFNSDSTRMAVVSLDLELCVWDVATATLLLKIDLTRSDARSLGVSNMSFSPDRQHLLVMRDGKAILEVWDAATGHFLRRLILKGRSSHLSESEWWSQYVVPSFSPCGRYVISSSFNAIRGTLIWKTEDGSIAYRNY